MNKKLKFDYVVIGGGLFGAYSALYLARKGAQVLLVEKENRLFQKASVINQARLHGGYHYPRSVATAAMSDEHKTRFTEEHRAFVYSDFEKYYGIDRYGSFTDAAQFERFCAFLKIRCERVTDASWCNYARLEALYRTEEHSFDPVKIADYYIHRLNREKGVTMCFPARIVDARVLGARWQCLLQSEEGVSEIETPVVINAAYAAVNAVNRLFGAADLPLTHEISEMAFLRSSRFAGKGLTVMDGPFGSIMPYGLSGLLSLSSVAYTHHKICYDNLPKFDCQRSDDPACTPEAPGICDECMRKPASNAGKMLAQMRQYFADSVEFEYLFSRFTIKSKLKASYIDDGRPTEISLLRESPHFYCLFAGKINSIYEVEKVVG